MPHGRYQKGEWVIVWDPDSLLFEEMAEVIGYEASTKKYIVSLYDGLTGTIREQDITKIMGSVETIKFNRECLLQLIDFALDRRDEAWFEDLIIRLKKI